MRDIAEVERQLDMSISAFTTTIKDCALISNDVTDSLADISNDVKEYIKRQSDYVKELETKLAQEAFSKADEVTITWTSQDVQQEALSKGIKLTNYQINWILYSLKKLNPGHDTLVDLICEASDQGESM